MKIINKAIIKYFIFLITDKMGKLKIIEIVKKKVSISKFTNKSVLDKKTKSPNPKKNSNECCI